MKVQVHFKTPDAVDYAVEHLSEDDREEAEALIKRFVTYGENITIEFDTEKGTATVLPK